MSFFLRRMQLTLPKREEEYSDIIYRLYGGDIGTVRNITFQVTEACSCKCNYCYQQNKGQLSMSKETGRHIVDLLFKMYEEDKPNAVINKSTKAIILDFIGGEPLLNIEVINDVCTYFMDRCLSTNHPWLYTWRASMISNGDAYFKPEVQDFLQKFQSHLSFSITLDGPKDLHDSCRVHIDGSGNFDNAFRAFQHYTTHYDAITSTKCTIAPGNLDKVNEIVSFFYGLGIKNIHMNPAFEPKWTYEQARTYFEKLVELANFCLEKEDVSVSVFREDTYSPLDKNNLTTYCGGYGEMLAFDPEGKAYPCLRYMKTSLGADASPVVIGDMDCVYESDEAKETLRAMKAITRKTENTVKCFECPIASGCAECAAWNYQSAGGVWGIRNTNICPMHQAEALANCYYWNKRYRKLGEDKRFRLWIQKSEALKIVSLNEFYTLKALEM